MGSVEMIQAVIDQIANQKSISQNEMRLYIQRCENLIERVLQDSKTAIESYTKELRDILATLNFYSGYSDNVANRKVELLNLLQSVMSEVKYMGPVSQHVLNTESSPSVTKNSQHSSSNSPIPIQVESKASSNKVFIVHGRDEAMKQTVARWLERIKLDTVILHEQTNAGQTIMEKFINNSDVGCAVVLLTPDDMGITVGNLTDKPKPRARQNVIFEMGFFIGKLGRKHVFVLYPPTKDFEIHSDFAGVIYIEYDRPDGAWRGYLAKELLELGYKIDTTKVY